METVSFSRTIAQRTLKTAFDQFVYGTPENHWFTYRAKESRVVFDAAYKAQRWALYTKLSIEHNKEAPKVAIL